MKGNAMPNFTIHYHRYTMPVVDYDALYSEAFAQIGESRYIFCADSFADKLGTELRTTITLSTGLHIERPYIRALREAREADDNFTPIDHHEIFAPVEELKAEIVEAGGWIAYWNERNPFAQHFARQVKFHEEIQRHQSRALMNHLLGFEPTDHSEEPPYIVPSSFHIQQFSETRPPTHTVKPCIDFGFEPTEGCE